MIRVQSSVLSNVSDKGQNEAGWSITFSLSWEGLLTGLVIIYVLIAPM